MSRVCFLLFALLVLVGGPVLALQDSDRTTLAQSATIRLIQPPSASLVSALARLHGRDHIEAVVARADGNAVSTLIGSLSEPGHDTDALARRFLDHHAALFGLTKKSPTANWQAVQVLSHLGRNTREYQLLIENVPVYRGFVRLSYNNHGMLRYVGSHVPSVLAVGNQRRLTAEQAVRLCGSTSRKVAGVHPVLYSDSKNLRHAWVVQLIDHRRFEQIELVVDAENGREMHREYLTKSARADAPPVPYSGRGKVWLHHPLAGPLEIVPLHNLLNSRLQGVNLFVQNEDHLGASSSNGDFFYEPSNYHFDEVMAYYHTETAHQRYLDMGYNRERLGVLVWAGDNLDNAYYMPWANAIYLGDGGERFYPLSREETIIYHEYAHAVVDKIQPLRGTEGSAMNEGQADYFACSFSNEPRVGEYVVSKKNRPYLRVLEHALHYPEDLQHESHDDGRIWAGTLWDIRRQLGADVTDRLILRSFFLLKEEPGYLDAILALFEADRQLFAGEHLEIIRDCFRARGYPLEAPNLFVARDLTRLLRFPTLHQEDRP